MLYWAEGEKSRCAVALANSDLEMIRFFARFLRTYFLVPDDRIRLRCHLFPDHVEHQREVEDRWLEAAELSRGSLQKTIVNAWSRSSSRRRVKKLPYGTAKLTVYSTEIVQTIYGSLQEYGGFDRPEWAD